MAEQESRQDKAREAGWVMWSKAHVASGGEETCDVKHFRRRSGRAFPQSPGGNRTVCDFRQASYEQWLSIF